MLPADDLSTSHNRFNASVSLGNEFMAVTTSFSLAFASMSYGFRSASYLYKYVWLVVFRVKKGVCALLEPVLWLEFTYGQFAELIHLINWYWISYTS